MALRTKRSISRLPRNRRVPQERARAPRSQKTPHQWRGVPLPLRWPAARAADALSRVGSCRFRRSKMRRLRKKDIEEVPPRAPPLASLA